MASPIPANVTENIKKVLEEAKTSVSRYERIKKRWSEWLTLFVDGIAIICTLILVFSHCNRAETIIQLVAVYILLFVLLITLAWQIHTFSRKSRYAESLPLLHSIIHHTRDALYKIKSLNDEHVRYLSILNLTFFAHAFSMITGTRCRASIKIIRKATDKELEEAPQKYQIYNLKRFNFIAQTYARDIDSHTSCEPLDELVKHWLIINTAFKQLMDTEQPLLKRYFIDNNLPANADYYNTSFDIYGEPKKQKKIFWDRDLHITWPLPYRSTMIWPIRKVLEKHEDHHPDSLTKNYPQDILGFLCIDSYAKGCFYPRYDFDYGALVADSLYMFLKRYREKNYTEPVNG